MDMFFISYSLHRPLLHSLHTALLQTTLLSLFHSYFPSCWYFLIIHQHEPRTLLLSFPIFPFLQCYTIPFTVQCHPPFVPFLSIKQHHMPLMDPLYLHGIRKLDTISSSQLDFHKITLLNPTTLHFDVSFSPYSTLPHSLWIQLRSGFSPSHPPERCFARHLIFNSIVSPQHSLHHFTHLVSAPHCHLNHAFNHTVGTPHHSISLWVI